MESIIKEKLNNFFSLFNGELGRVEEENANLTKKKIIGVYGDQGGVGVSSFIGTLSESLRSKGLKVLIIDSNLLRPYHYCKYTPNRENISLRTYLYNFDIEDINKTIVRDSKGIEYIQITPLNMIDLLNFNEDKKYFDFIRKSLDKLIEFYDVILIDINIELSGNFICQAFLKEIQLLLEISVDSLGSKLNKDLGKNILGENIKTIQILNKQQELKSKNSLPYKERYGFFEKLGISYIYSEDDSKDDYVKAFKEIEGVILNELSPSN